MLVTEPTVEDTIAILRGLKEKYEIHHGVRITDSAIVAAAELSNRYISDRFLPDKAIDLMDEAASRLRIEIDSMPEEVDAAERKLTQMQIEEQALMKETDEASKERLETLRRDIAAAQEDLDKRKAEWQNEKDAIVNVQELKSELEGAQLEEERATREGDLVKASEIRYARIPDLQRRLHAAEEALNVKQQDGAILKEEVSEDEIAEVVSTWTGIPVQKMMQGEMAKLVDLEDKLHERVVGQDEAVSAVAAAVRRNRVGISPKHKPVSFIFVGPTGVGKTELVKQLATDLFNTPDALIRLDMSEFMEKHSVSRLVGSPPGYVGYDEAGQLTEKIRRKPYAVVLFDEIEKAHPDVLNILLQILDDGEITDAHGRKVNFENTIIVMTSNAGSATKEGTVGFDRSVNEQDADRAMKALQQFLRPEFINRVDAVITFNRLSEENFHGIARIMLNELVGSLKEKGITFTYDDALVELLTKKSYSLTYGARNLRRTIQKELEDPMATKIIDSYEHPITQVKATVEDGAIRLYTL